MAQVHDNPWIQLPKQPPFVLPADRPYVDAYNLGRKPFAGSWIHTGRLPEPRQGPIEAQVVILQQNPSYSGRPPQEGLPQAEVDALHLALIDEHSPHQGLARTNDWWDRTCRALHQRFPRDRLSRGILSIEYFPYASATFDHHSLRLPSQSYVFDLVRAALARGAVFVITRGAGLWYGAVPELHRERDVSVFSTRNPQSPYISPGNLPDRVFERICTLL
jgi:hypothetical protein